MGMRADLVRNHLEAGRIEGRMAILLVALCCQSWKACADDMLWHDHLLRLVEGDIEIRVARAAADNHHCGPDMPCLKDRSPR